MPAPGVPDQGEEREPPAVVLLPPADEAGVERDVEQHLAAGDDDTAPVDAQVAALLELEVPRIGAGGHLLARLLAQPQDAAVRDGPRLALLDRRDGRRELVAPHVGVGHDHDLGVDRLDRGHHGLGLYPGTGRGLCGHDSPSRMPLGVSAPYPVPGSFPVSAAVPPRNDDPYGHGSNISPSASGSADQNHSRKTSASPSTPFSLRMRP